MTIYRSQVKIFETSTRRDFSVALAMLRALGHSTMAIVYHDFCFIDDKSSPIHNLRNPVELDPAHLPGLVWRGSVTADCKFYEFLDYNCTFCRHAGHSLSRFLVQDPEIRLGLMNIPISSIESIQVEKVQQVILRLHGPDLANVFYTKMLEKQGQATGLAALDVARSMDFMRIKLRKQLKVLLFPMCFHEGHILQLMQE